MVNKGICGLAPGPQPLLNLGQNSQCQGLPDRQFALHLSSGNRKSCITDVHPFKVFCHSCGSILSATSPLQSIVVIMPKCDVARGARQPLCPL